jgi:hypothetical protein
MSRLQNDFTKTGLYVKTTEQFTKTGLYVKATEQFN